MQRLSGIFLCFTFFVCSTTPYSQSPGNYTGKNFIKYFPDTSLAEFVANLLHKQITDHVTIKELAGIKGDFDIGVVPVTNLTGIGYLTGIDSFHCYKNEVTAIPAEIGNLRNLIYLDLCKAFELRKIPPDIGKLTKLKKIRLCLTEVNAIPKEIGNLTNLEILWICCNELTEIPKEIGQLKKLKELDIHSNYLYQIPAEICNLASLKHLDLSYCGLEKLPVGIGKLKNLASLNLFNNDLKYLPTSIAELDNLSNLNVYDNFRLSESYKKYLPVLLRKKQRI
jgi:Leucine-rich repeat (LRR) protein